MATPNFGGDGLMPDTPQSKIQLGYQLGIDSPHGDSSVRRSELYEKAKIDSIRGTSATDLSSTRTAGIGTRVAPQIAAGRRRPVPSRRIPPEKQNLVRSGPSVAASRDRMLIPQSNVKKLVISAKLKTKSAPSPAPSAKFGNENKSPNAGAQMPANTALQHPAAVALAPSAIAAPVSADPVNLDLSTPPGGSVVTVKIGDAKYSAQQIDNLSDAQRRQITGLTVTHEEHGEVFWEGPLDVSEKGSLCDKIAFSAGTISVYGDGETPDTIPRGTRLNRTATITLNNMMPKKTDAASLDKYEKRLRRQNAKVGATFLNYVAGKWQFQVDHFTKYGLSDSSEDEDEDDAASAKNGSSSKPADESTEADDDDDDEDEDDDDDDDEDDDDGSGLDDDDYDDEEDGGEDEHGEEDEEDDDDDDGEESALDGAEQHELDDAAANASFEPGAEMQMDELDGPVTTAGERDQEEDQAMQKTSTHRLVESLGIESSPFRAMKAIYGQDAPGPTQSSYFGDAIEVEPAPPQLRGPFGDVSAPSSTYAPMLSATAAAPPPVHYIPPSSPSNADLVATTSLTADSSELIADAGLMMGRSFRVGWGPNGLIAFRSMAAGSGGRSVIAPKSGAALFASSSRGTDLAAAAKGSAVSLVRIGTNSLFHTSRTASHLSPEKVQDSKILYAEDMEIQLDCSLVEPPRLDDAVPCPRAQLPNLANAVIGAKLRASRLLSAKTGMRQKYGGDEGTWGPAQYLNENLTTWRLFDALWGAPEAAQPETVPAAVEALSARGGLGWNDPAAQAAQDPYRLTMARRRYVSQWLQFPETTVPYSRPDGVVDSQNADEEAALGEVFNLLTLGDIHAACAKARETKDFRLAMLISQSPGSDAIRQLAMEQLQLWEQQGTHNFINVLRMKIYALLAGCMAWPVVADPSPDGFAKFSTCAGIDWKRAFGLHLWYECGPSDSVRTGIRAYSSSADVDRQSAANGAKTLAEFPTPIYPQSSPAGPSSSGTGPPIDMAYHLLKMFSDGQHPLASALVPASSTPCGLDFRLCWLLYTALRTAGVPSLSKRREEQLHTDFAAQLEAAGLWHYAAFVLLHVDDPKMRTWWVKELLVRNLVVQPTAEQENKVSFVQHQLHIPELWIDEAMAVRARFEGNDEVLANALQKCGRWNEAHATVMCSLAREAILARQYNRIVQLLAPLNNRIQYDNDPIFGPFYTHCSALHRPARAAPYALPSPHSHDADWCLQSDAGPMHAWYSPIHAWYSPDSASSGTSLGGRPAARSITATFCCSPTSSRSTAPAAPSIAAAGSVSAAGKPPTSSGPSARFRAPPRGTAWRASRLRMSSRPSSSSCNSRSPTRRRRSPGDMRRRP